MRLAIGQGCPGAFANLEHTWPLDARMAIFLLESEGSAASAVRARELDRFTCRVRARLTRVSDGRLENIELFVRDLSAEHIGFVCRELLDVGQEYHLDFAPADAPTRAVGIVGRCRAFTAGWHEGALHMRESAVGELGETELRVAV